MNVFIDTSAFVAIVNHAEREHHRARKTFTKLVASGAMLVTSNFVFSETYTTLLKRVGRQGAIGWGRNALASEALEIAQIDAATESQAWAILESHEDKTWSYVDATSFAFIERTGIEQAFSLDRHFAQRGLDLVH